MGQQTYVFGAELLGCEGVSRTIAVREDMTLVDLHYALQSAFGWDDDQLYSFWLRGSFWAQDDQRYTLGDGARTRLDQLGLREGRRIAYVFDYDSEWRVQLTLERIVADVKPVAARVLESVGVVPRRYLS